MRSITYEFGLVCNNIQQKNRKAHLRLITFYPIILRLVKNRDNIIVKHCEGKALSELGIDASSAHDKLLEEVLPKDYYKLAVEGIS